VSDAPSPVPRTHPGDFRQIGNTGRAAARDAANEIVGRFKQRKHPAFQPERVVGEPGSPNCAFQVRSGLRVFDTDGDCADPSSASESASAWANPFQGRPTPTWLLPVGFFARRELLFEVMNAGAP